MEIKPGKQLRYMGPYDVCAGFAIHPYGGKMGTVIDVVTVTPLPPLPISIQFSDGMVIKAAETEVREPSLPY